jgi:NAD(P)-dependent dehydrogenase (short-subunit alcohol dehydrogenase family)
LLPIAKRVVVITGSGKGIDRAVASEAEAEADAYTSSMSGVDPFISSRVGMKLLTKTVPLQLADNGIRVNAIFFFRWKSLWI